MNTGFRRKRTSEWIGQPAYELGMEDDNNGDEKRTSEEKYGRKRSLVIKRQANENDKNENEGNWWKMKEKNKKNS